MTQPNRLQVKIPRAPQSKKGVAAPAADTSLSKKHAVAAGTAESNAFVGHRKICFTSSKARDRVQIELELEKAIQDAVVGHRTAQFCDKARLAAGLGRSPSANGCCGQRASTARCGLVVIGKQKWRVAERSSPPGLVCGPQPSLYGEFSLAKSHT